MSENKNESLKEYLTKPCEPDPRYDIILDTLRIMFPFMVICSLIYVSSTGYLTTVDTGIGLFLRYMSFYSAVAFAVVILSILYTIIVPYKPKDVVKE